ncbi:hypothetical protein ACKKBG_A04360 [Auxenochlorella protothecoides x Auxenochlorella symbiontica]
MANCPGRDRWFESQRFLLLAATHISGIHDTSSTNLYPSHTPHSRQPRIMKTFALTVLLLGTAYGAAAVKPGEWWVYPFLSTAVDHQKRVLQVEGDGRLGADMFCKSKGYLKSGDFLELEEAGNIWPIGTTNLANDQFWTGANATAYLYITCLSLETQSPSIGQGENGNIGYKNTGINNIGNYNSGEANVGNHNAGDFNMGDGHALGSDSNVGFFNEGMGNTGTRNNGTGNVGTENDGIGNKGNHNDGTDNEGNSNIGFANDGNNNIGTENNGNNNTGTDNVGLNNLGTNNFGKNNVGTNNTGSNNFGWSNTGANNSGLKNTGVGNSGTNNIGAYNSGFGNVGTYLKGTNQTNI